MDCEPSWENWAQEEVLSSPPLFLYKSILVQAINPEVDTCLSLTLAS